MKTTYLLLGMIISLLQFSGCATLSKEECLIGNWELTGIADATAGRAADHLINRNKACAKVGIAIDYQLWEKGWQQGLAQYCTAVNAYNIGRQGNDISSVCPTTIASKLEEINADGRQYYSLNKQLDIEKKQLKKYDNEYQYLKNGGNLNFINKGDARSYLIELLTKIDKVNERISNLEYVIEQLQNKYGY